MDKLSLTYALIKLPRTGVENLLGAVSTLRNVKLVDVVSTLLDEGETEVAERIMGRRWEEDKKLLHSTSFSGFDRGRNLVYTLYEWEEKERLPAIAEDIGLEEVTVKLKAWARLHLNSGLLEVHSGDSLIVDRVGVIISRILLGSPHNYKRLVFSQEQLAKWATWSKWVKSATFENVEYPGETPLEKAYIRRENLGKHKLYKEFSENGELESLTIRIELFTTVGSIDATVTIHRDGRFLLYRSPTLPILDKLAQLVLHSGVLNSWGEETIAV